MARIILDALAKADLDHHLDIEPRALLDPLRLDQFHLRNKKIPLLHELELDLFDRVEHLVAPRHIMARRKYGEARKLLADMPGQWIEQLQ